MNVPVFELERTLEHRGRSVRWTSLGNGPAVVLCHGTPWSSVVWRRVAAELATTHTVHLWDMPGYGRSDMSDGDVSLRAQGELLAALVDSWGLDRPHVVAHDFGGAVALRAHLLHDVAFASLALIDVVALRPWGSPFFTLVHEQADVFARLPPNLHEALVAEYISGASSPGLEPDVLEALVEPWTSTEGQAAFYRQIAQADEAFTDEIEPRYGELTIPTAVIWGTDDTWIPVDRAHRLAEMIPGAELHLIDGAGHLIMEDRPDELASIVAEWVRRQP